MSRQFTRDFLIEVQKGLVPGHSIVNKFGSGTVSTTLVPITRSLVYQTPVAATALEFVSSSTNDTSAGSGAREVTVIGLDSAWNEVSQTVVTNGTTAVALSTSLIRLYRWYVSASGSYATQAVPSHDGTLTIRVAPAGVTWSVIDQILTTGMFRGQSHIGATTVPIGFTGYVFLNSVEVDTTKTVNVYFFQRPNADVVAAPFSALRIVSEAVGISGQWTPSDRAPRGPFVGPCDLGYMGVVSATSADVSVDFEVLLVAN